ncbi:DUF3108 domain-containing protein [Paraperlucidibaca sp.]|jgi:hypothetical protein|uniref:DUF3108 domain-containing protein n=1 Tax=Paraperlucidibaca sp. TaxID=2708021 RepID=UPI003989636F|tara:strand:+ start:422 stop:1633 length:1212 start_codon:yes stop_codon:yes gene_type:complete
MTGRQRLCIAIVLSALAHVLTFTDIEWSWPWQDESSDEVLSKKPAEELKRVKLAFAKPKPESEWPVVYLLKPDAPVIVEQAKPVAAKPKTTPKPEIIVKATEPTISDDLLNEIVADAPAPEIIEPAPSFPVQVTALQRASYYGFQLKLTQQWFMEGFRYAIINNASKFGFTATLSSEGQVSPEGLHPEHYRLLLNNDLKQYADFDRDAGVVIHGKAGHRETAPITPDFQDMASLPYHVAVSYSGEAEKRLMVTTGSSVYEIALNIISEDQLKLPGGVLRTIHLTGSRIRSDGTRQSGYDIWLAPGLRNFPVKFRGPDSKGNILEMAVMTLMFDGKAVFGKDVVFEPTSASEDALPESMLPEIIGNTNALPEPSTTESPPVPEPTAEDALIGNKTPAASDDSAE